MLPESSASNLLSSQSCLLEIPSTVGAFSLMLNCKGPLVGARLPMLQGNLVTWGPWIPLKSSRLP